MENNISDTYDSTATYAVGDYCIYNNILYKCKTAITTPEAFTPAKWDATNAGEEIEATFNKIALKEDATAITPVNAFNTGGDGMVLDIFNKDEQVIGHLVIRQKDISSGYAMELYFNDWSGRAWAVNASQHRTDEYTSADANNLYTIPLNDGLSHILSVLVTNPVNVYASNPTNTGTSYGKSVRLYNYDGTPYLGAATITTIWQTIV